MRSQEKGIGQAQASGASSDAPKRNHFYGFRSRSEQEEIHEYVHRYITSLLY